MLSQTTKFFCSTSVSPEYWSSVASPSGAVRSLVTPRNTSILMALARGHAWCSELVYDMHFLRARSGLEMSTPEASQRDEDSKVSIL